MHTKKTIRQRLLASVLALVMVFGMMPAITMTAEAAVTEQFDLPINETYYFDLSSEVGTITSGVSDKIGTINTDLPDDTLHYVPFTYVGTINAYILDEFDSGVGNASTTESANPTDRSLFVSDYNVSHTVSWGGLADEDLIYGKEYNTNYTLRSLSVGSDKNISQVVSPANNEWDVILGKSGLTEPIKNGSAIYTWGQDTSATAGTHVNRAIRGVTTGTLWENPSVMATDQSIGWRPALEVDTTKVTTSDGLKAITLNLNGGTLSDSSVDEMNIVYTGANYTAPDNTSLTRPNGNTGTHFAWNTAADGTGTSYDVGASVPNSVTTLYAQWAEPTPPTATFNPNGGQFADGSTASKDVTVANSMIIPTPTWGIHVFEGWYDNADFTGNRLYEFDISNLTTSTTLYAKWAKYTTDANNQMAYTYVDASFNLTGNSVDVKNIDIKGVFDDKWKQVTYSNDGFTTALQLAGETITVPNVDAVSSTDGGYAVGSTDLNVAIDLSHENEGQTIKVTYTVKNTGSAAKTFSLASGGDIQIGADDAAPITSFAGDAGFKMVSAKNDDKNSNDEYAQFNVFLRNTPGVTDVDGYWYGNYIIYSTNYFTDLAVKSPLTVNEYGDPIDSGATWHWADETIGANETKTYTIKLGIGGPGSEDVVVTPVQNINGKIVDKDGTTPVADATVKIIGNGVDKSTTTNTNGEYTISDVPNGIYTVTITKDGKTQTSSVTVTSGTIDHEKIVFVTDGNKNTSVDVVAGTPPITVGNLENMFDGTEQDTDMVEIELKVAKIDNPADKEEIEFEIVGQNVLGMYLDIELLKTVSGGAAQNIQPPSGQKVTITIQLPPEHRNKAPYQIIHVHNGATEIITPIYDSTFHTLTFDASKFSTYAYTYTDSSIVTHTLTVGGIGTGGSVNGTYANSNVVRINAGTRSGYTFTGWTSNNGGTFANASSASTTFTMPANDVTITANWALSETSTPSDPAISPLTGVSGHENPQMGNNSNTPLLIALMFVSALGLTALFLTKKMVIHKKK